MPRWFAGTVNFNQPIDESTAGTRKCKVVKTQNVTETYLFDAVSYTDAEARMYKELADVLPDFMVTRLMELKLAEVFEQVGIGKTWYKVRALSIIENEKTGRQRSTPSVMLVNAQTPKEAYERIEANLKLALDPFEITNINKTKILNVYPYTADTNYAKITSSQ